MKYKLILFDIDGTLIFSGYAGSNALKRTFEKFYGIKEPLKGIRPDGMTDPEIIREIFRKNLKREVTEEEMEKVLKEYIENLKETVWNKDYKVFEGVRELLTSLKKNKEFLIGLATGNIYEGAKIKLLPSNLWDFFEIGAFASDSPNREEILVIAKKRADEYVKNKGEIDKVIVIGDTPLDIIAAKKAGFIGIAVATGNFKKEELEIYKPFHVFENFKDYKKIFSFLFEI
jgi:phosphoglycolate phosphatase-like HAD superfamily hydrolase